MALDYHSILVKKPSRRNGVFLGWLAVALATALCVWTTMEPFQMAMSGPPGRPVHFLYSGIGAAAIGALVGAVVCGTLTGLHIYMQRGQGKLPWILGAISVGLAVLSFPLYLLALRYVIAAYRLIDA